MAAALVNSPGLSNRTGNCHQILMHYRTATYTSEDTGREAFSDFRRELYRDDPFFRPYGLPPASAIGIILYAEDRVCGHLALVDNPGIRTGGEQTLLAGWYECTDDQEASHTLLSSAFSIAAERGARHLLGPLNGDTWHSYRFADDPDSRPFFLDIHHKPWYAQQFRSAGFTPVAHYHSSRVELESLQIDRTTKFLHRFAEQGIIVREIDAGNFEQEINNIYDISIAAFRENLYYTPLERGEVMQLYAPLQGIVDPRFVLIAEDADRLPLGFAFAIPDLHDQDSRTLVIKTVAVRPESSTRGLGTLLAELLHERGRNAGYSHAVHALMQDSNASTNVLRDHSSVIRRYTLYSKAL